MITDYSLYVYILKLISGAGFTDGINLNRVFLVHCQSGEDHIFQGSPSARNTAVTVFLLQINTEYDNLVADIRISSFYSVIVVRVGNLVIFIFQPQPQFSHYFHSP